jgi:hypothetical protein
MMIAWGSTPAMGRRALLFAVVLAAGLLPTAAVRAAADLLPAPDLISPVDTGATSLAVDFRWARVEGASGYRLVVRHGSGTGATVMDATTVNDRYITLVNLAGDPAWWSVAAIDDDGVEGDAATAMFTTAAVAPTAVWPPDEATVAFPDVDPTPVWEHVTDQPETLFADQAVDTTDPIARAPDSYGPGAWRWQVLSTRLAGDDIPASPPSDQRTFTLAWPGAAPALDVPSDGASVGPGDSVRLSWGLVPGAALYAWELGPVGGPVRLADHNGSEAPWADLPALPPGTYQWRVRAVMAGSVSTLTGLPGPWSPYRTLTITATPAVTQTYPSDGATLSSWPVLRWDEVDGARAYTIQVAESPDPDAPLGTPTPQTAAFSFAPAADHLGAYSASSAPATRYWRVRAESAIYGSEPAEWSTWRSFTVDPGVAVLDSETPATRLGPADCTSDACPDLDGVPLLRWEPVAGAASYRVFLRWDGTDGPGDAWIDTASTGLALGQYAAASPGARTAWAVVACPAAGCSTTMPDDRARFSIDLPAPGQTGWADGTIQASASVEMRWLRIGAPVAADALATAGDYEVEYRLTPGLYSDQDHWFLWTGGATATTVDAIPPGAQLDWRVRSTFQLALGSVVTGPWSPWRSILRQEPGPQLISPADGSTVEATPVLAWQGVSYPVLGYRVELARASALAAWGTEHWDWAANTGATSIHAGTLTPGLWRWRVQRVAAPYHQDGGHGPWSVGWFTVAGDPTIRPISPGPEDTVVADDVELSWAPWADVPYYSVMIGTSSDVTWDTAVYVGYAYTTVHPVSAVLPTGTLYWRVCSSFDCSDVTSTGIEPASVSPAAGSVEGTSDVHALEVSPVPGPDTAAPVSRVTSVDPRPGARLGATGTIPVTIRWTAADIGRAGIASQSVQLRRGSGAWVSLPVTSTARTAGTRIRPDSSYTVRVRATDRVGHVSAWSTLTITTRLRQETAAAWGWSGRWIRDTSSRASGGATRWSIRRGATATVRIRARSIALIAPRSSTRGSAQVWVDGTQVATIRLDQGTSGPRRLVFVRSWPTAGRHTITIRVNGTKGHPRVDLDAIVSLR